MSKTAIALLSGCAALVLMVGSFGAGVAVGWVSPHPAQSASQGAELSNAFQEITVEVVKTSPPVPTATVTPAADIQDSPIFEDLPAPTPGPEDAEALFAPFWQAWDLVKQMYVDQPVDEEKLMQGAISGMLDSLGDEHTSYMDPDQYTQAQNTMEGDYDGIGAWVDTTGEYVVIISPMPGSPAEKAGLKTGDTILAVDGEDMEGIDGSLVLRQVLGPAGTKVILTIRREGVEEPFDVTITRARIVLASVESDMLEGGIAYIKVTDFAEDTNMELEKALDELLAQNPEGLILDLRNNPGGYLQTAIEITSQFIPDGTVMLEEFGDGSMNEYKAIPGGMATEIPLVVLVNEGSASASEITAGAIQDRGRGQLVGITTFGKGSVQTWTPLVNDQGAVRITVARWLTPSGRQIHKIGLEPDVQVELTEADLEAGRDPQLDKAIEILTQ